MYYTIYKITHLASGKIYIGKHQTSDPQDDYMGSGKLIKAAIEKYGKDQFRKDVLYIFDREEDMNAKEAELVTEEFCSCDTNYNLCPGGHGGWGYINSSGKAVTLSEQRKANPDLCKYAAQKANEAKREKWENDEDWASSYREKLSLAHGGRQAFLGKSHSEETKRLMSEKARKRLSDPTKNSQYGTMWITNGEEAKKIKTYEPIPVGWRKGRK